MTREEIFERVNDMCDILSGIINNDLLDYCLNCLANNDYACEDNYREYVGEEIEDEEEEEVEEDEEDD